MKKVFPSIILSLFILFLPLHTLASPIEDVREIIENDYIEEINGNIENASTIDEIMGLLDSHSAYFTKEEYESFINSIEQTTVGIGVIIEKHEKGILILQVIDNGSAQLSGIEDGDIITAVNGQATVNMTVEQASSLIIGQEGTTVSITLLKADNSTRTINIIRKPFTVKNVTSELLYGKVGYIRLNSFSSNGASEVKEAYQQLLSQGADSFILDLQNNGGGYVSTAEELIGLFPGASIAYNLRTSTGYYKTSAPKQEIQFPLNTRVLVNNYSASASEMTAAALLDQHAAILYGEQTYGKGTMQSFYRLSDGSVLKLTVGEFYGPNDTVVKSKGITPHVQTKSNPIYQAHFDSIVEKLNKYQKLNDLLEVPTTKQFTINFNKGIQLPTEPDTIQLVNLGGDQIDISFSLENDNKRLIVKPVKPLQPGGQYMLLIHPKIQDYEGKTMKNGYYLKSTVQSKN